VLCGLLPGVDKIERVEKMCRRFKLQHMERILLCRLTLSIKLPLKTIDLFGDDANDVYTKDGLCKPKILQYFTY